MKRLKRMFVWISLMMSILNVGIFRLAAYAQEAPSVVINEIAWAGSADGSNDEWIELYNVTNSPVDLSGWYIEDDSETVYMIESGVLAAHGYFVIEDTEEAVSSYKAQVVTGLSLANAGDSLVLKNKTGQVIDSVNTSGGAWFAGNSTSKASMERINPSSSGNDASNWATALSSNGEKGRNGKAILGTPGSYNSNFGGSGPEVFIEPSETIAYSGDELVFEVAVKDVTDFYAYGFELNYPALILEFISAQEQGFMKADGTKTAFNAALKDGKEGTLVVGNARMANPAKGIDGSGVLFQMKFKVISEESDSGAVEFGGKSFVSDSKGDIVAKYTNADVNIAEGQSAVVQLANVAAKLGEKRYSFKISWQEDLDGANGYIVKKMKPNGQFAEIANIADSFYVDEKDIVPGVTYKYQVIAVKNNAMSEPVVVTGVETRGIKGDNDRSDSVDGRDIEKLARAFASGMEDEEYNPLADSNFDGVIDGSDLIDLGMNFGMTYKG
ncbi:lamin tail domain-containing protein [Candidatus Peregrinibacteria bacterium]|nr:lamin tail domain-containing protein [Candidatus Peregrinibacteria bacterium]